VENRLLMIFIISVIYHMPMKGDELEGTGSLCGNGAKCVHDSSRKVSRGQIAVSAPSKA
jgi:hypothetical protein